MPLGSEGDPPGTQWLKRNLRGASQRQPTPQERALIQRVSDNEPRMGSWQFAIRPLGDQWQLLKSMPESDEWQHHSTHDDLGDALGAIQQYRANPGTALFP